MSGHARHPAACVEHLVNADSGDNYLLTLCTLVYGPGVCLTTSIFRVNRDICGWVQKVQ
jgi:hypothetical protein